MERPSSQLENARPSGLKAPSASRLPTSTAPRPLQDLTQSDLNSKTARDGSMAPFPPPMANGKHKMTGAVPESAPKRKTLAERAGEPIHQSRMHLQHSRIQGMTASAASRVANSSGYGPRVTNHHSRLQTALQHQRAGSGREIEDETSDYTGRRKGVQLVSLNPHGVMLRPTRKRDCLSTSHPIPHGTRSQHQGSFSKAQFHGHGIREEMGRPGHCEKLAEALRSISTGSQEDVLGSTTQSEVSVLGQIESDETRREVSPSKLPKPVPSLPSTPCTPTLIQSHANSRCMKVTRIGLRKAEPTFFATKASLTPFAVWDTEGRLQDMDQMLLTMQGEIAESVKSRAAMEETLAVYKARVEELTEANRGLTKDNRTAMSDLERARNDLHTITIDLEQARRDHVRGQSDLEKAYQQRAHDMELQHMKQIRNVERESEQAVEQLEKEVIVTKQTLEKQGQERIAELTSEHWEEIDQLKVQHEKLTGDLRQQIVLLKKSDEGRAAESATVVMGLRNDIVSLEAQAESLRVTIQQSSSRLATAEARTADLEQEKANLLSKTHFLEGNQEAQSEEFTNMTHRLQAAESSAAMVLEQLRKEETVRRRLNAQILELKGNIRVFARFRPVLSHEEEPAQVEYPDAHDLDGGKEVLVHAPTTFSATGKERNEKHSFGFDRVYGPEASNFDVFEDCRELVQSVIDGFNVSILSYGQTGSGKTFGMSGIDGIIPSSIEFLLSEITRLRQKGWKYAVTASFVEVYNETLNDLLGDAKSWDQDEDLAASTRAKCKTRHEIHHDGITGKTTVSNMTSVSLWPPPENEGSWIPATDLVDEECSSQAYTRRAVARLLETATKNRRVAATKANERSSRSHSVFVLTLKGDCSATGESSEGILNLVDLAGSERLKHSGAEGGRAKETAAINTSLKSLGDVIEKVGTGGHVPYRNSKLTYLLQSSLGGVAANGKSSRTLMLLHLSPLQAHWQETKTSLQFGTKVHGTHIGSAKRR